MSNAQTGSAEDAVFAFHLSRSGIRGRAARLSGTLTEILRHHRYRPSVEEQVVESVVLATLVGQLMNPGWKLSLQVRCKGRLRLIATDYLAPLKSGEAAHLRAFASCDRSRDDGASLPPWNAAEGYFATLIDRNDGAQPFQGLVPLEMPTLSGCAEAYFRRSEQIPTVIEVSAKRAADGWRAGGIMLQCMPDSSTARSGNGSAPKPSREQLGREEDWVRVCTLLKTVEAEELQGPGVAMPETVHRLFHEELPKVSDLQPVQFGCSCSADKVRQGLSIYSAKDLATMTTEAGLVTADCQFCGAHYEFDPATLGIEAAGR